MNAEAVKELQLATATPSVSLLNVGRKLWSAFLTATIYPYATSDTVFASPDSTQSEYMAALHKDAGKEFRLLNKILCGEYQEPWDCVSVALSFQEWNCIRLMTPKQRKRFWDALERTGLLNEVKRSIATLGKGTRLPGCLGNLDRAKPAFAKFPRQYQAVKQGVQSFCYRLEHLKGPWESREPL